MEYDAILRLFLVLIVAAGFVSTTDPDVPKQMKRIYRRFKQGKLPRKGINSVRCIRAHQGSASSNGKLLFSLDAIHKQEELIKAEIYFYRRSQEAANMLQTDLYEISPYYQSLVQSEVIKSGSNGWVDIDITPTIKQCTNTLNTNNQLGVNYYTINQNKATKPVDINEFTRHHGLPFLLIYTNNSRSLDMDQISGLNEEPISKELDSIVNPPAELKEAVKSRRKRSADSESPIDNGVSTDLVKLDRKMNQISNGYYYWEGADDYFNELTNAVEPNSMDKKPTDYQVQVDLPMPFSTEEPLKQESKAEKEKKVKLQLLPWPKVTKKKQGKDSKPKNTIPTDWGQPAGDQKKSNGCRREAMRLDFEDIGWGLRIIEPKKYEAYYCTGQCGFPYALGMKPTNHATLQSILSSLQRNDGVPQPCCVADKLSPLTIMFKDGTGDIVVKLYENMVVESCSCR